MKNTIDMARKVYGVHTEWTESQLERLKQFEAIVRADERNRTWTQEHWTEYEQSIVAKEREACAKVCDELQGVPATEPRHCAEDIRARGKT